MCQVEEGKNLCLYRSDNLGWIQQFNSKIEKLKREGLQLETIYVGMKHSSENEKEIMDKPAPQFSLNNSLSFTKFQFFWLRLESMRSSKLRLGKTTSSDYELAELSALLDMNEERDQDWVVIGGGSDIICLQGKQVMECLNKYAEWGEKVDTLGLVGAIINFLEPPFLEGPCNHSYLVPSTTSEGEFEGTVVCEVCRRPMKKYVVYHRKEP